ncbi:MAG: competence/damage-inducible protein A [Verrucomicrobia bacterium]|jgi:nicotinamide-nucleotide amidase|nr:competence/damage-inducible protein A [Verrucomicrobiota bacterium]
MTRPRKAELLAIGDELLNGLRANSHLTWLGGLLADKNLPLHWGTEIRDEASEMVPAFHQALDRADLVVVTGGLGPTSDDFTVDCMAEALGREVTYSKKVEEKIEAFFRARGREPTQNNYKQCHILSGADIIPNPNGTAPGQWIEENGHVIVLLPGPPMEMQPMVQNDLLPRLEERGWVSDKEGPVRFRTIGLGESKVAELLHPLFEKTADKVRVAYCAHLGYVDVRLHPVEGGLTEAQIRQLGERCREALGESFLGYGTPDLSCLILRQLRSLGKSLAVAESCTGGLLASRFTDVAGASKVFTGGLVCYRNEVKENILGVPGSLIEQHGAVSAECAVAMATAAAEMMEADYALAITGYAGPEGGRDTPAGTVYLGYHSPAGVWSRKAVLPGNRTAVKERAVTAALDFLRRKIEKYKMVDLLESLRC